MQLPYYSAVTVLAVYLREMKTFTQKLLHFILLITPKLEIAHMSFNEWMIKQAMLHSYHGIFSSNKREQTWYMQQSGCISRELCWMKKANLQMLHVVWFYLYTIFLNDKITKTEQISRFQQPGVWGRGSRCSYKRIPVIEMSCILTISMSVSKLWYFTVDSAKCYLWEKLGKGYLGSLCMISYHIHVNV